MLDAKSFDTHGDGSAGDQLRDFLNSIHGKYVTLDCLHCFELVLTGNVESQVESETIENSR